MSKTVVITGASSGIGRTAAQWMVKAGYQVVNLDRIPLEADGIRTVEIDLLDAASLEKALVGISEKYEVVGLINNVAFAKTKPLEQTDDDLLMTTFDLNLRCAAQCARTLVPHMRKRGFGRIINIASRSALGRELRTAYAASKGGLIAMTRVWALELAKDGITSNCIAPGPVATEFFDSMNPPGSERRNKMIEEIPVRRIGEPRDVANAICFFLSEDSEFINGQTLYVCGGLSVGTAPL